MNTESCAFIQAARRILEGCYVLPLFFVDTRLQQTAESVSEICS